MNKRWLKRLLRILSICSMLYFVLANVIAYRLVPDLTYFHDGLVQPNPNKSVFDLVWNGIKLHKHPFPFIPDSAMIQTDTILESPRLVTWRSEMDPAKAIVICFHGIRANKATQLNEFIQFYRRHYITVSVDFRAHGQSEGNVCSVGFHEAEDVQRVVDFYRKKYPYFPIVLYGQSMGSVAIMRAISELGIKADALVLESPFGSLRKTISSRISLTGIPAFPNDYILTFWGGHHLGFNGFKHVPEHYAKNINIPTLLLQGENDQYISLEETETIYRNLNARKKRVYFVEAKHEDLFDHDKTLWLNEVFHFLKEDPRLWARKKVAPKETTFKWKYRK